MKTSKYIQIVLLIFIFGITLTLFMKAKSYSEKTETKPGAYFDTKLLDDFSVIVVKEKAKINLKNDSINRVFSRYKINGIQKEHYNFKEIELKNDTLFIDKVNPKYNITIRSKSVKKIIGLENTVIWLGGYHQDTLQIDLTKSKLKGFLKSNLINSFKVMAKKQSKINLDKFGTLVFDSITQKYNHKVEPLILKNAEITLKNKSTLWMPKPLKLIIDADSLSTYRVYK